MRGARGGNRLGLVLAAAATALLAGCTGVPTTSVPETVEPIQVGGADNARQITPTKNSDARTIVNDFLAANAVDPLKHTSARAFLTPAAQSRWSDTTATVISGELVGSFNPGKPGTVSGRVVGTLSAAGIYTPSLQGTGDGGKLVPFPFRVVQVRGQNRIDQLPNGLVLTTEQFQQYYKQRALYFYDLADRSLVPDARWSALTGDQLDDWLVNQLVAGPRAELRNAVTADTIPQRANARRLNVTQGTPDQIEIPGASQLDAAAKIRLAAQVAHTLNDVSPDDVLSITDGGTAVPIPESGDAEFTMSEFMRFYGPTSPAADVYYLRGGKIARDDGELLRGPLNNGSNLLDSIAVSRPGAGTALAVAAVADDSLLVGTESAGLRPTGLHGGLSRPAWAPGLSEVWVGAGGKIYRVAVRGRAARASQVTTPSTTGGGRIVALRLSPEGSRIAVVIAGAKGAQQLFVGSVVRTAGQVRIDGLQSVSPEGVVINDLAWIGGLKIFAIGYDAATKDARIYETNVDGSFWTGRSIGSLPAPPDSVTAAVGQLALVSTNNTVWVQQGRTWESAGASGEQTSGDQPVYVE